MAEKLAKPCYYRTLECLFVDGCRLIKTIDPCCRCDSVSVAGSSAQYPGQDEIVLTECGRSYAARKSQHCMGDCVCGSSS
jgi:hypothetical protein